MKAPRTSRIQPHRFEARREQSDVRSGRLKQSVGTPFNSPQYRAAGTLLLFTLLTLFTAVEVFAQGTSPNLSAPHVSTSQAQKEVTINQAVDQLDNAIAGTTSINVAGSSNVTLTTTQAQYNSIVFTGGLTGNINVIVPAKSKQWTFTNNTTGAFTLTVKTLAGSGVAVTQGSKGIYNCDGTNTSQLISSSTSYTLPTATTTTLGGVTTTTSNSQVVSTDDSRLTVPSVTVTVTSSTYNASGSAVTTTTVGTTGVGTSVVVTSATSFALNQGIFIAGAGSAGGNYIGQITGITGTTFTISPATATAVAGGALVQHDDTVAIQTAITAVYNQNGGTVYFPRGFYRCNGPWQATYNSILYINQNPFTSNNPLISVRLLGELQQPGSSAPDATLGVVIATTNVTGSGTFPSVIAAAPYADTGAGSGPFSRVCPIIENLNFRTSNNPTFSVLQFSTAEQTILRNVFVDTLAGTSASSVVQPTTTTSYGVWLPQVNNNTLVRADNVQVIGFYNGFRFSEHAIMDMCVAALDAVAFVSDKGYRPGWGRISVAECAIPLSFIGGVSEVDLQLDLESDYGASWYSKSTGNDILDASNFGRGRIVYHITKAATGETPPDILSTTGGVNLSLYNLYSNSNALNPWSTLFSVFQVGGNSTLFSENGAPGASHSFHVTENGYTDNSGVWRYISTDTASNYYQLSGTHNFRVAASGTAGAAITWTTALTILNSGNVGIGTTNPQNPIHVSSNSVSGTAFEVENTSAGGHAWVFKSNGTSSLGGAGTFAFRDATAGAFRMIIDANGNVGIGQTSNSTGQMLEINGGMALNTATAQPTCSATTRGTFWVFQGGAGVKDSVQVCAKDAGGVYAWRTIY